MGDDRRITGADIQRLAARLDWEPEDAAADSLADHVDRLLASMEPVSEGTPDHRGTSRDSSRGADEFNAFITTCDIKRNETGVLASYDIGIKDNIAVEGIELTAGSAFFEGCVPTRNAPVVNRLLDAGARLVGKTNMDEFAFGPTGETSHFGPALNPNDRDRSPGGSSSGSGAAVAAELVDLALGTDTGGSVRIPASYCGVVGFKPTLGAVPIRDVVELARSLDTVGLLANSIDLIDRGFSVMAGLESPGCRPAIELSDRSIGVPESFFEDPVDPAVSARITDAVERLEAAGSDVRWISLPGDRLSPPVWRVITMSELFAYFHADTAPYRIPDGAPPIFAEPFRTARAGRLERLSDPLKQYLLVGSYLVADNRNAMYATAVEHRRRLADRVDSALNAVDVLLTPTTPTPAIAFDEFTRESSHPINANTHLFNLSGHPAISVPCGEIDGLPVGLQLVGARDADRELIATAGAVLDTLGEW